MSKKSNKSTTKILKGENTMAKQAQKTTIVAQETKKGETNLKEQVMKLLGTMPVAQTAKTRKGTDYNILNCTDCEEFWELWHEHKEEIKSFGVVVFAQNREYFIRDFTSMAYDCSKKASKERSKENLAKAREVHAENLAQKEQSVAHKKSKKQIKKITLEQGLKILAKEGYSITLK